MNDSSLFDLAVIEDLTTFSSRRGLDPSQTPQVIGASQTQAQPQPLDVNIQDSWSHILRKEFQEIQFSRGPSFSSSYSRIDEMETEEEYSYEEESFEEEEESYEEESFSNNSSRRSSHAFSQPEHPSFVFIPPPSASSKSLNNPLEEKQIIDMDVIELEPTFNYTPSNTDISSTSPFYPFSVDEKSLSSPSTKQSSNSRKRQRDENFEEEEESYSIPNISKNRYEAVLPTPQTRVKLNLIHGIEGSDYINANYIDGEVAGSSKYYIACQAPLENTLSDFWRMIWEQNCGVIVMLTDLNPSKATQYWPEEGKVSSYGNILVCHKNSFQLGEGFIVRSLLLRLYQEGAVKTPIREVVHLQYENWPDFGVPASTKPIQDLMLLLTKFKERASSTYNLGGPAVVHCSAGLGRTGTFIALHIAIQQISTNSTPCIKQIVLNLRKQRRGMVCTFQQYAMIYTFLLHFTQSASSGSSSIPLPSNQTTSAILNNNNNNNTSNSFEK